MLRLRIPPVLLTVIFGCAIVVVAMAIPVLTIDVGALSLLGPVVVIAGLAVCAAGVRAFRRASTTVDPMHPDRASALVRAGIYSHTRNPMYLGFLLLLAGLAVWFGNLAGLIIAAAFVPYMNSFQIEPEEQALSNLFGDEFSRYRQDVRRWL